MIECRVAIVEPGRFGEDAELFTNGTWVLLGVVAENRDGARGPANEVKEDVNRRRFTSAVRPEEAEYLAGVDLEGDVADGVDRAEPLGEGL